MHIHFKQISTFTEIRFCHICFSGFPEHLTAWLTKAYWKSRLLDCSDEFSYVNSLIFNLPFHSPFNFLVPLPKNWVTHVPFTEVTECALDVQYRVSPVFNLLLSTSPDHQMVVLCPPLHCHLKQPKQSWVDRKIMAFLLSQKNGSCTRTDLEDMEQGLALDILQNSLLYRGHRFAGFTIRRTFSLLPIWECDSHLWKAF